MIMTVELCNAPFSVALSSDLYWQKPVELSPGTGEPGLTLFPSWVM